MAQSGGIGEILPILLIGGAAWVAWSMYQSYEAGVVAAAAAAVPPAGGTSTTGTSTTGTTSTTGGSSTPTIVIPAGFSVAADINNSYKGTVTYNGSPATFNVILANAGQPANVVYNSAGADITALLGPANVTTLVNAFQAAANQATITGVSGFGQFIAVPSAVLARKVIPIPARRREFA